MLKMKRVMQIDIPGWEEYLRHGVSFRLQLRSANTIEWIPVGMRVEVKGAPCFHTSGAEPCGERSGSLSKYQPAATAAALMRPTWELTNVHHAQVGARSFSGERAAVRCDDDGWTVSCDSDELLLWFRCQIWRSTIWSSSALASCAFSSSLDPFCSVFQVLKNNYKRNKQTFKDQCFVVHSALLMSNMRSWTHEFLSSCLILLFPCLLIKCPAQTSGQSVIQSNTCKAAVWCIISKNKQL